MTPTIALWVLIAGLAAIALAPVVAQAVRACRRTDDVEDGLR